MLSRLALEEWIASISVLGGRLEKESLPICMPYLGELNSYVENEHSPMVCRATVHVDGRRTTGILAGYEIGSQGKEAERGRAKKRQAPFGIR